jgi:hypothetical protein
MAKLDNSAQTASTQEWDGSSPGASITVWNTCNMFEGDAGACGIARLDEWTGRYQIVYLDPPPKKARFFDFTLDSDLAVTDLSVEVTVGDIWDGISPGGDPITVWNTCAMFAGDAGACGVARLDEIKDRYQIIQLECQAPSEQSASATPPASYADVPVKVPLSTFEQAAGDLTYIDNGDLVFSRPPVGGLRLQVSATWANQIGPASIEQSIIAIELSTDGGNIWNPLGPAIIFSHAYIRIPPDDNIAGGIAQRSYWPATSVNTGDRIRLTAASQLGTPITSLTLTSLEALEGIA